MRTPDAETPELSERGFIIIPNVLSSAQVERMKELVSLHETRRIPQTNLHETEVFETLIEQNGVHRLVQQHFAEKIFYYGGIECMQLLKVKPTRLHDDAKGISLSIAAPRFNLFDTQRTVHRAIEDDVWPAYRLFIYLDDHREQSGGTKIRAKSHRRSPILSRHGFRAALKGHFDKVLWPGQGYTNPIIKAGDAVLFNLKCRHSGLYVRLRKPFHRLAFNTRFDNFLKSKLVAKTIGPLLYYPFPKVRKSVSIDFCRESDWARGYQINRVLHPSNSTGAKMIFDCSKKQFQERLAAVGLQILNNPLLPSLENFLNSKDPATDIVRPDSP